MFRNHFSIYNCTCDGGPTVCWGYRNSTEEDKLKVPNKYEKDLQEELNGLKEKKIRESLKEKS